jgi:hypothetical protein
LCGVFLWKTRCRMFVWGWRYLSGTSPAFRQNQDDLLVRLHPFPVLVALSLLIHPITGLVFPARALSAIWLEPEGHVYTVLRIFDIQGSMHVHSITKGTWSYTIPLTDIAYRLSSPKTYIIFWCKFWTQWQHGSPRTRGISLILASDVLVFAACAASSFLAVMPQT